MKGKLLSLVTIVSLLAVMFIIDTPAPVKAINWIPGAGTIFEARLPMPCPAPGCPITCTANYQNCTMPAPYTVGSEFNVTIRINNAIGMTGYGISLAWNSTWCEFNGNWWLSPAMQAEVAAGRWGAPMAGVWNNDTFPWVASNFGTYNNFGHSANAPNTLTGTFDLVIFEFVVMAPGYCGIYIWKDQGLAWMPETVYGALLVGTGWFTGAGPMAYDVIWWDGLTIPGGSAVLFLGVMPVNAILELLPPPPMAPICSKSLSSAMVMTGDPVTCTVTQLSPGFNGSAFVPVTNMTIDWGEPGPTAWCDPFAAAPLGQCIFTHTYTTAGVRNINVSCFAAGYPAIIAHLAWHNLTNVIDVRAPSPKGIDVYEVHRRYPNGDPRPAPLIGPETGVGPGFPGRPKDPQSLVELEALVFYGGDVVQSKLVAFEVSFCGDCVCGECTVEQCMLYRVAYSNRTGIAEIEFRIPEVCWDYGGPTVFFGKWLVNVTVEMCEEKFADYMFFEVGYIITLSDMASCNMTGTCDEPCQVPCPTPPISCEPDEVFKKCEYVCFSFNITNIDWVAIDVTLTLVIYDDNEVPIGQCVVEVEVPGGGWCEPREVEYILCLHLPKYAYCGFGWGYINAFTRLPRICGLAWCPEIEDMIEIVPAADP